MIRKNLLKTAFITTIIVCMLSTAACGKKTTYDDNATQEIKTMVSSETQSPVDKEIARLETSKFEGVSKETDESDTESEENNGEVENDNGRTETDIVDDNDSNNDNYDNAPSERQEITIDNNSEDDVKSDETLVNSDETQEVEEEKKAEKKNDTPAARPDSTTGSNQADMSDKTPADKQIETPAERITHMETKYIYYHDFNGGIYYTDSVTYLAYEDGTPVNETLYSYDRTPNGFPECEDKDKLVMWWMINTGKPMPANSEQCFFKYINFADYPGSIDMYPGWI